MGAARQGRKGRSATSNSLLLRGGKERRERFRLSVASFLIWAGGARREQVATLRPLGCPLSTWRVSRDPEPCMRVQGRRRTCFAERENDPFRDSKLTRAKLGPARSRAHPSTSAAAPPHRRAVFRRFGGYAGDLITLREWRMVALALMSFYSATSLRHAAPTAGKPTWRLWRHARARSACAARLGKLIDAGRDVRALGAGR